MARYLGSGYTVFSDVPEIRVLIYTTNSIEGLNRAIRKVIKTRTLFSTEDAARKLIYLVIKPLFNALIASAYDLRPIKIDI